MLPLPEIEKKILNFWKENQIFEKSLQKEAPKGDYVFYDGPPFATGTPHYGHLVASLMKDIVPRYQTMRGYHVERKWGWDCHGMPIENIVEEKLGLKTKKDIEKIGIDKFNEFCRQNVLTYVEEWRKVIERWGRWVDMDNAYKTMDLTYMESVWWVFKELWDKKLIYEGYKAMHICPRCETTLSQYEVSEGYKDVTDLAVTAKFELADEPNVYILAWTTTPWTLIGNVALASLLAGLPLGLLISAVAAIRYQAQYAGIEIVKNIALGAVVAPVFIFVFGLVVIAPLLTLLRHLGYGGPFFVYAISIGLAVPFLSNGVLSGLAAISMALAASYVFCRFAYSDQLEQLTDL